MAVSCLYGMFLCRTSHTKSHLNSLNWGVMITCMLNWVENKSLQNVIFPWKVLEKYLKRKVSGLYEPWWSQAFKTQDSRVGTAVSKDLDREALFLLKFESADQFFPPTQRGIVHWPPFLVGVEKSWTFCPNSNDFCFTTGIFNRHSLLPSARLQRSLKST